MTGDREGAGTIWIWSCGTIRTRLMTLSGNDGIQEWKIYSSYGEGDYYWGRSLPLRESRARG
jgi:hypothetical protein